MRGRPPSGKTLAVLALVDSQIFTEAAIEALRNRDFGTVERALLLVREAQRMATGQIEGIDA